ncbi:diguanylate cyclase [Lichenihabitans sp. Uapishka_5]|uniref:diguanylate cyclase n=1 Tax=Lichenihabitans sp. Uapishka_5 TaxID=3037302 RepID=UPI0029E80B70|nr:diguanylate cyclase [Lichenihabitans sp. Uapishka_5]
MSGALATAAMFGARYRRRAAAAASHRNDARPGWLEHGPDGILVFDAALSCTFASASMVRLLGEEAETYIGQTLDDLVGEEQVAAGEAVARVRAGRPGAETLFRTTRPTGEPLWVEMRIRAAPTDGTIIASLRDISTRKTAELALRVANLELNRLAGSDGLTDLANRRRFDQALEGECRRASRNNTPVSLLLIDVDRFKAFNDHYGHQAGDTCLKLIAGTLQATAARTSDVVARFGGEEFALLLPGLDERAAATMAAEAHAAVLALSRPHVRNPDAGGIVTVSVGCATVQPTPDTFKDIGGTLIAAADRALYDAKRLGRNRVVAPALQEEAEREAEWSAAADARLGRLDALRSLGALRETPSLNRIARMATMLLGLPGAFITVLDHDGVVVVGHHGMGDGPNAPPQALCETLVGARRPVVVRAPATDAQFGSFAAEQGLGFLAVAPLLSDDDLQHLGGLWVVDRQSRDAFDEPKRMLLSRLAALAMEDIEGRHRASVAQAA